MNERDKIWDAITKGISNGTIKKGYIDPKLFEFTKKELLKSVLQGFGGVESFPPENPRSAMVDHIKTNVHYFSAFKTHHQLREATDLLLDESGKVKPWAQYRKDIQKLDSLYNVAYLETERNQALGASQMADKWASIQEQKEYLPLLKYSTVHDSHVRKTHEEMEGITKPVDDPFWKKYYPPNDWNCRCKVIQLHQGDVTEDKSKKMKELPALPKMFQGNSGIDGVIFSEKHPYFTQVSSKDAVKINDWADKALVKEKKKPTEYETSLKAFESDPIYKQLKSDALKSKINLKHRALSEQEIVAINGYTFNQYIELNGMLKGEAVTNQKFYEAYKTVLNSGLSKLPNYEGIVFRGSKIDTKIFQEYKAAKKNKTPYNHPFLTSTSEVSGQEFDGNVKFIISSKRGKSIDAFSRFKGKESEVLFKSDTKFMVTGIKKKGSKYLITMEEA